MSCPKTLETLRIRGARTHNLHSVDVDIPLHRLVVITGVSGSGKSSLAFDTICLEGQRRYLESFSSRARQLLGKLGAPEVDSLEPLGAAIALDQKTAMRNPRSTVGTISGLDAHLRLLVARLGRTKDGGRVSRGELSFNGRGACPACRGLGVQDSIAVDKIIADDNRSLREGALVITTDSGYVMYSQVTMDVLNQVCQAHGFHVDIPWREMTDEQKRVVLYGSDRIEIPFGKHTLESRMKWSGITARPRQTGLYGGIIPVMEGILKRDRNKNILRFVRTGPCAACGGTRLGEEARAVRWEGRSLPDLAALNVGELATLFREHRFAVADNAVSAEIAGEILRHVDLLIDLGLDYLTLDRDAPSLSGGEAQRIRLATIAGSRLRGILYVLDEPSIGLHPLDQARLLGVLRRLVAQGNSVIVVEHDEATMRAADWLVDIGPGAGTEGGRVLYSGPPAQLLANPEAAAGPTGALLAGRLEWPMPTARPEGGVFQLRNATRHNLQGLDVDFRLGSFHVVCGVSGAGKSSLLRELNQQATAEGSPFRKIISIDQAPIGRTPRSNAATYTGLFDPLRALFAAQPEAKERGLKKGDFSFNNKGGRCAECEGAGVQRLGMHFLGDVEVPCPVCGGRRFHDEILAVHWRDHSIADVLDLSISAAADLLNDQPKLSRILDVLVELGLGYLKLGQPSTTLSGGEAQRVKLATELARPQTTGTLYILDEPTTGLHAHDTAVLLRALDRLVDGGGTVVVSEHHAAFLRFADEIIDLGPDSGARGGRLVYTGPPAGLLACKESLTGQALAGGAAETASGSLGGVASDAPIVLEGVRTHNLRDVDVSIPVGKITVVTGVSGSGKSSLAIGTLHAEGRARYAENFSTYIRQQLSGASRADLDGATGLLPSVAVTQGSGSANPRSTVATMAEIHPLLRLLYSRLGEGWPGQARPTAGDFSFNQISGACPRCRGLGAIVQADPRKLVTHPERSLLDGALDGTRTGRFYGAPDDQHVATLRQVGADLGLDFTRPWQDLGAESRRVAMHGAGPRGFTVTWAFKRGKREGRHEFHGTWLGFCGLVDQEYQRVHADRRGDRLREVMSETRCPVCAGCRLRPAALAVKIGGLSLADLCALDVDGALRFCADDPAGILARVPQLRDEVGQRLETLQGVGLGYLTLDRATGTLSGGESRRLRLARQLGTRLRDLMIVLDEPTLGLHSRDTARLWGVLEELRDAGNTLVLVEHDPEVIRRADHVIDLGPGAGREGGRVVASGTPEEIAGNPDSLTGRWLGAAPLQTPASARRAGSGDLVVRQATANNLRGTDAVFLKGAVNAVVGVSGSGKSSLVFGALAATAAAGAPVGCRAVEGLEDFIRITAVRPGQSLGGSGNPATAAGLAGPLRQLLAGTEAARAAGFKARHFSTSGKGGRCETCQGRGQLDVALDFLADISTPCPDCGGEGFLSAVLACRWNGRNIADMMRLTIGEARGFLQDQKKLAITLDLLAEVGLDYLTLGQPTRTLSGGERQRLDLACRLLPAARGTVPELLLCDEPTAGLHMADIDRLSGLLGRLADAGHTVIVTEHNAQLIAGADRVLELGPGAGKDGGRLMEGPPFVNR